MNAFQWFSLIQTVLMGVAAVIVALLYRGFYTGRWVQKNEDQVGMFETRLAAIERRLDNGGAKMSDLASEINGLPERLRLMFVPVELFHHVDERNKEDRSAMRAEIEKMWHAIRASQGGPREAPRS